MALTNSQYDHFMRIYEKRQLDNENRLRGRYEEVYDRIPRLRELDQSISELSVDRHAGCWMEMRVRLLH